MPNELFLNLDKIHTTPLGAQRIRKNLSLGTEDPTQWCLRQIQNPGSLTRTGKNWYVRGDGFVITINASSYTIITAHREKPKKGNDMRDVGLPGKLDDIPELKQALIAVFDTKTHREISRYGLLLADHTLQLAGIPLNETLAACYSVNRRWQDGGATFQEARDTSGAIHDLARSEESPAKAAALRAVAQIAAIPHVKRHALIASDYAVKTVNLLHPGNMDAVKAQRTLQINLMQSV